LLRGRRRRRRSHLDPPKQHCHTAKRSGSIIIPLAPTSAASPPQAPVPKVIISDLFLTTARLLPSRSKRSA